MVDTDGEPLRLAVRAEPDVVSPNELEAEELVGHEFNDVDDRARGRGRDDPARAPREAIMTVPDGCYAYVLEDGAPRSTGCAIEEQEARSPIGSGDAFLAGYVAARYQRPLAGGVPALRRRLRRRVDPALRRRDARSGPSSGCSRGRGRAARARRGDPLRPARAPELGQLRAAGALGRERAASIEPRAAAADGAVAVRIATSTMPQWK